MVVASTAPSSVTTIESSRALASPKDEAEPARERVTTEQAFIEVMSQGMAALERGDYRAARDAFQRANGMRPAAAQVADGLTQAEQGLNLEAMAAHREKALAFEAREAWREAAKHYQAVLELDPAIRFAQQGKARSLERAELSKLLEFQLKNPSRLSDDKVLEEASALLSTSSGIEPAGPELRRQLSALEALIAKASMQVRVAFESDDLTEVVIYKVGRLGKFAHRELDLRPGTYTVVGSRRGYQDVRRQLVVSAGVGPERLVVRCEVKI